MSDPILEMMDIESEAIETGRSYEAVREERRQEKVDAVCLGLGGLVAGLFLIQWWRGKLRPFTRRHKWE